MSFFRSKSLLFQLNEIELPTGDEDFQGVFDDDSDDALDLSSKFHFHRN